MRLPLLIAALGTIAAAAACDRSAPKPDQPATAANESESEIEDGRLDRSLAGTAAPDTVFQDPSGEEVSLADFRGKPLLVNLWATWCAPCIEEMPTLDGLAAREGDKLTVLAISQDRDGRDKVEAFFDEHGFEHLDSYLDAEMALLPELRIDTLPTTILYDAEGREVWRMIGIADWTGEEAAALLAEAGGGANGGKAQAAAPKEANPEQ